MINTTSTVNGISQFENTKYVARMTLIIRLSFNLKKKAANIIGIVKNGNGETSPFQINIHEKYCFCFVLF